MNGRDRSSFLVWTKLTYFVCWEGVVARGSVSIGLGGVEIRVTTLSSVSSFCLPSLLIN